MKLLIKDMQYELDIHVFGKVKDDTILIVLQYEFRR